MSLKTRRIAVTGAAGQIAYSLIFRLAAGELFGQEPVALHLLEMPQMVDALKGVEMELQDCAFPLLKEIKIGSNPEEVFEGVDTVFLVGAKPRGPGMERKDLLSENGQIFVGQGNALAQSAAPDATVLIVGNPCNTNCLIAKSHGGKKQKFYAMTRLDQNRAVSMLARKAGVDVKAVSNMTIWGNHSSTQVPDIFHAKIDRKPVQEIIRDKEWLENTFFSDVQKRGAVVIAARGKSSAASACQAALDGMKSLLYPTAEGEWFSMGVSSDQNPYGIQPGLIFSFPCRSKGNGDVEIVKDLQWDPFLKEKIQISEKELLEEKRLIEKLL